MKSRPWTGSSRRPAALTAIAGVHAAVASAVWRLGRGTDLPGDLPPEIVYLPKWFPFNHLRFCLLGTADDRPVDHRRRRCKPESTRCSFSLDELYAVSAPTTAAVEGGQNDPWAGAFQLDSTRFDAHGLARGCRSRLPGGRRRRCARALSGSWRARRRTVAVGWHSGRRGSTPFIALHLMGYSASTTPPCCGGRWPGLMRFIVQRRDTQWRSYADLKPVSHRSGTPVLCADRTRSTRAFGARP